MHLTIFFATISSIVSSTYGDVASCDPTQCQASDSSGTRFYYLASQRTMPTDYPHSMTSATSATSQAHTDGTLDIRTGALTLSGTPILTPASDLSSETVATASVNDQVTSKLPSDGPDFSGDCGAVVFQYQRDVSNVSVPQFTATEGWFYTNPTPEYMCDVMFLDTPRGWIAWSQGNQLPRQRPVTISQGIGYPMPSPFVVTAGNEDRDPLEISYGKASWKAPHSETESDVSTPPKCTPIPYAGDSNYFSYGMRRFNCTFPCK